MIQEGYNHMLAEETFMIYFYGTDEEIRRYQLLTGNIHHELGAIETLLSRIKNRYHYQA